MSSYGAISTTIYTVPDGKMAEFMAFAKNYDMSGTEGWLRATTFQADATTVVSASIYDTLENCKTRADSDARVNDASRVVDAETAQSTTPARLQPACSPHPSRSTAWLGHWRTRSCSPAGPLAPLQTASFKVIVDLGVTMANYKGAIVVALPGAVPRVASDARVGSYRKLKVKAGQMDAAIALMATPNPEPVMAGRRGGFVVKVGQRQHAMPCSLIKPVPTRVFAPPRDPRRQRQLPGK